MDNIKDILGKSIIIENPNKSIRHYLLVVGYDSIEECAVALVMWSEMSRAGWHDEGEVIYLINRIKDKEDTYYNLDELDEITLGSDGLLRYPRFL